MLKEYAKRLPKAAWDAAKIMALAYALVWVFDESRLSNVSLLETALMFVAATLIFAIPLKDDKPLLDFSFSFKIGGDRQ